MTRTVLVAAVMFTGCGPAIPADTGGSGGADGGAGGDEPISDESDDDTGAFGSDGSDEPLDWPAGSDPRGDVGDHTLSEDLLLVVDTDFGPLFVHMFTEHLGDGFQAWAAPGATTALHGFR